MATWLYEMKNIVGDPMTEITMELYMAADKILHFPLLTIYIYDVLS